MKKDFLFISTVNLTTNPRILKEIMLADSLGHHVTFLGFKLGNWSDEMDLELQKKIPRVKFVYLDATRQSFMQWLASTCIEKASGLVNRLFPLSLKLTSYASSKRSVLLLWQLRRMFKSRQTFDLILAHTSGALFPAFWFSMKSRISFAFDVEDYHPWESIKGDNHHEVKRRETILKQILPNAFYVSAAAPLISAQVKDLVPAVIPVTIYNSFPKSEFIVPADKKNGKIKMVWFSQNINAGRGLELVLRIWESLKNDFELTLIGKLDKQFYEQYLKQASGIELLPPMTQHELHNCLSQFDIGLAIDVDGNDDNRKLVITNKILAYYQAGLYIIATNTPAQLQFIMNNDRHGVVIEQSSASALERFMTIAKDKSGIRYSAKERFNSVSEFNWENESILLLDTWKRLENIKVENN